MTTSNEQSFLPTPRVGRLTTLADVRGELSRVYRSARRGEIATQDLTRFSYSLSVLAKIIEQSDLEKRVLQLEESQGNEQQP